PKLLFGVFYCYKLIIFERMELEINLNFKDKRVLVIGDIILDKFVYAEYAKMSPEYTEVPVLNVEKCSVCLGGAANVASNIKTMGATPYLVGIVGQTYESEFKNIETLMKISSINTEYLVNTAFSTTVKTRIFNAGLPMCRLDRETEQESNDEINSEILNKVAEVIEQHQPHAIILQDYNKGVLNPNTIPNILNIAKINNIPVFVDPKYANWELYNKVDFFKPNAIEFDAMTHLLKIDELSIEEQLLYLKNYLQVKNLFITQGKDGSISVNEQNKIHRQSIHKSIEKVDVCGAGDSVIAMLCLSTLSNNSMIEIAYLANLAGYIACSHAHIYTVKFEDISKLLK
ncbi:MAG: hypothetical protein KDC72_00670, partial [Bacteroidetes bacterium]|nr:hypothetical protein [Bacteroidota bacterium]